MNVSDAAIMGVVSGHIIVLLGSLLAIIIAVAFCCRRAHQWRWQRKRASELSNEQSTSGIADAEVDRAQVMREIDETLRMATLGYVGWYIAHVVLGICSIALPAIAATLPAEMAKYFSVAGAVAAAIVVFVRPHDFATAFDNACVSVWRTSVEFSLRRLTSAEVSDRLSAAIEILAFKYGPPTQLSASSSTPSGT